MGMKFGKRILAMMASAVMMIWSVPPEGQRGLINIMHVYAEEGVYQYSDGDQTFVYRKVIDTDNSENSYVEIVQYEGRVSAVTIPDTIDDLPVRFIKLESFDRDYILSLTLPESFMGLVDGNSYIYSENFSGYNDRLRNLMWIHGKKDSPAMELARVLGVPFWNVSDGEGLTYGYLHYVIFDSNGYDDSGKYHGDYHNYLHNGTFDTAGRYICITAIDYNSSVENYRIPSEINGIEVAVVDIENNHNNCKLIIEGLDTYVLSSGSFIVCGYRGSKAESVCLSSMKPFIPLDEVSCSDYYFSMVNNGVSVEIRSDAEKLIIPDTWNGHKVTKISANSSAPNLKSLVLPNTVDGFADGYNEILNLSSSFPLLSNVWGCKGDFLNTFVQCVNGSQWNANHCYVNSYNSVFEYSEIESQIIVAGYNNMFKSKFSPVNVIIPERIEEKQIAALNLGFLSNLENIESVLVNADLSKCMVSGLQQLIQRNNVNISFMGNEYEETSNSNIMNDEEKYRLKYALFDDHAEIIGLPEYSTSEKLTIPAYINGTKVTKIDIDDNDTYYQSNLWKKRPYNYNSLLIPDTIENENINWNYWGMSIDFYHVEEDWPFTYGSSSESDGLKLDLDVDLRRDNSSVVFTDFAGMDVSDNNNIAYIDSDYNYEQHSVVIEFPSEKDSVSIKELDVSLELYQDDKVEMFIPESVDKIGFSLKIHRPYSNDSFECSELEYSHFLRRCISVIRGYTGSYAQSYADRYGIRFKAVDDGISGHATCVYLDQDSYRYYLNRSSSSRNVFIPEEISGELVIPYDGLDTITVLNTGTFLIFDENDYPSHRPGECSIKYIIGHQGSEAERFANENNISFFTIEQLVNGNCLLAKYYGRQSGWYIWGNDYYSNSAVSLNIAAIPYIPGYEDYSVISRFGGVCEGLYELTIPPSVEEVPHDLLNICPNLKLIRGVAGSAAETLAREYQICFKAVDVGYRFIQYEQSSSESNDNIDGNWDNIVWHWENYTTVGTVTAELKSESDASFSRILPATVTTDTTAPGCITEVSRIHVAKIIIGNNEYTDTFTETTDALGHINTITSWNWSEDHASCTANLKCSRCNEESSEVITDITHEHADPTAVQDGYDKYTASLEIGGHTYSDTAVIPISADDIKAVNAKILNVIKGNVQGELGDAIDETRAAYDALPDLQKGCIDADNYSIFAVIERLYLDNRKLKSDSDEAIQNLNKQLEDALKAADEAKQKAIDAQNARAQAETELQNVKQELEQAKTDKTNAEVQLNAAFEAKNEATASAEQALKEKKTAEEKALQAENDKAAAEAKAKQAEADMAAAAARAEQAEADMAAAEARANQSEDEKAEAEAKAEQAKADKAAAEAKTAKALEEKATAEKYADEQRLAAEDAQAKYESQKTLADNAVKDAAEAEKALEKANGTIEKLEGDIENVNGALENALNESKEAKSALDEAGKTISRLTEEKENAEESASQAADKLDALTQENSDLKGKVDSLTENNRELQSGKDKIESDNAALQNEKDKLEADNAALQNENDKLGADNAALQNENDKLGADNAALQDENDKLGADNAALQTENEKLISDNGQLQNEVDKLTADNEVLRAEIERLNAEIEALKAEIAELSAEIDALKAEIAVFNTEIEVLRAENESLKAENAVLKAENEEIFMSDKAAEEALREARKDLDTANKELDKAEKEKAKAEEKLRKAEENHAGSEEKINKARADLEDAEARLNNAAAGIKAAEARISELLDIIEKQDSAARQALADKKAAEARVRQAEADLAAAEARANQAEADKAEAEARAEQAEADKANAEARAEQTETDKVKAEARAEQVLNEKTAAETLLKEITTEKEEANAVLIQLKSENDILAKANALLMADAETVSELIDGIGTVKLTDECRVAILAARTAYDSLAFGQKTLVLNSIELVTAEKTYEALAAEAHNVNTDNDNTGETEDPSGQQTDNNGSSESENTDSNQDENNSGSVNNETEEQPSEPEEPSEEMITDQDSDPENVSEPAPISESSSDIAVDFETVIAEQLPQTGVSGSRAIYVFALLMIGAGAYLMKKSRKDE